jgi:SAM-dependent methyltransferase
MPSTPTLTTRLQHGLRRLQRTWQVARHTRRIPAAVAERMDRVRSFGRRHPATDGEHAIPGDPSLGSDWERVMWARYLWARELARDRVVVDLGCGFGWGSFLLADVAARIVAVDRDQRALEVARQALPTPIVAQVVGDLQHLPLPAQSVDLVLCMELIEHLEVESMRLVLAETRRVLKPGGLLLGSSAFPATSAEAERLCATNPYHLHIYTAREWLNELGAVYGNGKLLGDLWFRARR